MSKISNRTLNISAFQKQELTLFDIQPSECRKPLEITTNNTINWEPIPKRVFFFNPTKIYERINEAHLLNPFQRQCTVSITFLFTNEGNKCACGCGKQLSGRKKRWASKECSDFAFAVFAIISGRTNILRNYRSVFIGGIKCEICNDRPKYEAVELDHIYPVKFGGGGSWLSNYQFKCKKCHREKTNKDFGFKQNTVNIINPTLF